MTAKDVQEGNGRSGRPGPGPGPTMIEVWAPGCRECRAMRPALEDMARSFAGRVDLQLVNVVDDPERVLALGVRATPTLIGFRDGTEAFRVTGRRSPAELAELFAALAEERAPRRRAGQDTVLRVGTGLALLGLGLGLGPAWPLLAAGAAVVVYGMVPLLRGNGYRARR